MILESDTENLLLVQMSKTVTSAFFQIYNQQIHHSTRSWNFIFNKKLNCNALRFWKQGKLFIGFIHFFLLF